jgi:KDO2-lipid IV(A) lauroyltransferase
MIYFVGYHLIGYRKEIVTNNLVSSFPEKTESEINKIRKQFYRNFCDWLVESVKGQTMRKNNFLKRVKVVEGMDIVNELLSRHKNIVMMAAHLFNWEWLCITPEYYPDNVQVVTVYQPASNIEYTDVQNRLRSRFGISAVSMNRILPSVVRNHQNDRLSIYYLFADQSPPAHNPFWTTFLNRETSFFMGGEKIASKFGYAVVYLDMKRKRRGRYEVAFKLISENAKDTAHFEITSKYARILEEHIKRHPDNWLWSHRRWKRTRPKNIPIY